MKRALKIFVVTVAVVFVVIQVYRPDRTAAPIVQAETLAATTQVPENVAAILTRSCNDCHSNQTEYPWYARVAPISWLLAHHIDEGRRELNFSIWNTYETKKKIRKLDEICQQVTDGTMPHYQYLWMHGDAKLSDEDKKMLCDWAQTETVKISANQ